MNAYSWALAGFVLLHIGVSATGLRGALVARLGLGPYRIAFSLASAVLLVAMILGFSAMRADPFDPLNQAYWAPPTWLYWPAIALMFVAFVFVVCGVLTPGPTFAGFEASSLAKEEPARGVLRITRHPFLWGVALWAGAHLLLNGERFALTLFGALGVMVLFGTRSIDRKGAASGGAAWEKFLEVTSNIPFAAILQGRNKLALGEIGWRWLASLLVFAAIGYMHAGLFGVAAHR